MLITNATLVTWESPNRILGDHAIYISGDQIHEVGPTSKLEKLYPKAKKLNAHGQIVMPGGICAHTHFYGAFARGMAIPGSAPKDFPEILEKLWWPLDKSLLEEDIRYSALICLVDAIKHGTTTLIDHHASPNAIDGSLDIIAEAADKSGLRAVLCYEVTDRDGPEKAAAGIKENVRFMKRLATNPHPRLAGTFGLHASLTLSGATLQACRAAAPEEAGFHIHVAEHEADEYDSLNKSNMRVVDRLQNHEILGPKTTAAHHRTGSAWKIYPMYDWSHGQNDSMEGITHSLCSLEYENHRPLYEWFLDQLEVFKPRQIEFARLNLNYTVMSKRKLRRLVEENYVNGWDDPRMPTLRGMRRRGYTAEAIVDFVQRMGISTVATSNAGVVADIALLESCVRDDLNKRSPRRIAVTKPLKLLIDNYPDDLVEEMEAINNPEDPSAGTRKVPFSKVLYIEQDDFRETPPPKYYRLYPG